MGYAIAMNLAGSGVLWAALSVIRRRRAAKATSAHPLPGANPELRPGLNSRAPVFGNETANCDQEADPERRRFCHNFPAPAAPAAAASRAIVAGSGTERTGSVFFFLSFSTFGGFSTGGFPDFAFP